MPRKGRGGARQAQEGKSYANRTDMQMQPVRVATGQPYGAAKAQEAAQQAVPLPDNAATAAQQIAQAAQQPNPQAGSPVAGMRGSLDRPTEIPQQPITNGIASGPGAGPEAMGFTRPRVSDEIGRLAMSSGSRELMILARQLEGAGK